MYTYTYTYTYTYAIWICTIDDLATYLSKYMHVVRFQNGHRYSSDFCTHDKWLFGICEFDCFLNMYVYININLCKFRRLPSCGQAQGVVPFLRCWETYCAKQVCFPLLKNIQSAQSSKPLSTGHCWGNGFQNPFGRENAQKKWHGSFVPSWAQGRPNDPMYQLSRYKRRSGYGDGSLLDMFLVCSYQDLLAGFDGDFWA